MIVKYAMHVMINELEYKIYTASVLVLLVRYNVH